jgi:hypothetical protein
MLALAACDQTATETEAEATDDAAGVQETAVDTGVAATDAACDRQCLIDATDAYIAAIVAHDPAQAPLADDIAFVENVMRLQPGEGLWQTATAAPTTFQIHVADEELQSVGYLARMTQQHPPLPDDATEAQIADAADGMQEVLVAIRLKFEDGLITEAEHIVAPVTSPASLERLQTPRPGLVSDVPEAQRLPHDELARIGMSYYDALDDNDGSLMPFAADCQRHENGMVTAGPEAGPGPNPDPDRAPIARECAAQLDSKSFTYIDRIDNRRLAAADPVTGLAMGLSHFRHPMDNLPYEVIHTDGSTSERNAENMPYTPFDMPAAHIFKIGADGLVHEIEAVGISIRPHNSPTGWE